MMNYCLCGPKAYAICRALIGGSFCLLLFACNTGTTKVPPVRSSEQEKPEPLFPFHDFILSEKSYLDSVPIGIVAQVQLDGKLMQETLFTADSMQPYWRDMLAVNPNATAFRNKYTEQSFVDMTLGYHTFVIEAVDTSLALQRATVQVHPETNVVTSLALESRFYDLPSGSGIRRMLLRRHKGLQQTELFEGKNGMQHARVTNIRWGE